MATTRVKNQWKTVVLFGLFAAHAVVFVPGVYSQSTGKSKPVGSTTAKASKSDRSDDDPRKVLTAAEWKRVDDSVDRALTWLAGQQQHDGSFPTLDTGQPAVTSLCILAFMAHGHLPSDGGPYGQRLERALEYVLNSQKESGLIARLAPDGTSIDRKLNSEVGVTTAYNHAIASLTISEIYGMGVADESNTLQRAIAKALRASLQMQRWPKTQAEDKGGWRYVNTFDQESDVSLTGWELMFLRSARNAGFDVPKQPIDDAVAYIRRAFSKKYGTFTYIINPSLDTRSRAMAGAGILALAHAGLQNTQEAQQAGEWLLRQKFEPYNRVEPFTTTVWQHDRYHYAVFYACQGAYQLGGRYWEEFFPRIARTLLSNQRTDGSWAPESHPNDGRYGNAYTTALMILSLGAPNQLLPIFQR